MARSWQYPRWRRILMQATMWLILAATVGLAALVTRQRTHTARTEMSQVRTVGDFTITLPTRWKVVDGGDGAMLLVAREPGGGGIDAQAGRTLSVHRQRLRGPM